MDIQARKLELIEEFLKISDESIIKKLESVLKIEETKKKDNDFKRMSVKEFREMIDKAKEDKKSGRVTSHGDLKKKIESWE